MFSNYREYRNFIKYGYISNYNPRFYSKYRHCFIYLNTTFDEVYMVQGEYERNSNQYLFLDIRKHHLLEIGNFNLKYLISDYFLQEDDNISLNFFINADRFNEIYKGFKRLINIQTKSHLTSKKTLENEQFISSCQNLMSYIFSKRIIFANKFIEKKISNMLKEENCFENEKVKALVHFSKYVVEPFVRTR